MTDPFENPAAFAPFMLDDVTITASNGLVQSVRAAVLLNAKDTAEVAQHTGDCYSIVLRANIWPEATPLTKGAVVDIGSVRAYVYRVQLVGSYFHIAAATNIRAAR